MRKFIYFIILFFLAFRLIPASQEEYLKIDTWVDPGNISLGSEGTLKIKIVPRNDIKISSHLGFMIKLDDNENLSFPKIFFTSSELDLKSKQENNIVYLEFNKIIPIPFKVNDHSLIGRHRIYGEVIFTAIFKDNWSLKTYQKFNAEFISNRNTRNAKKQIP